MTRCIILFIPFIFCACFAWRSGHEESLVGACCVAPACRAGGCLPVWLGRLPFTLSRKISLSLAAAAAENHHYYVHWAKTVFLLTLKPPTCDNAFSVCTFFSFILPVRVYHIVSSVNCVTSGFESGLWRKMCSWRRQVRVSSGGHADPGDLGGGHTCRRCRSLRWWCRSTLADPFHRSFELNSTESQQNIQGPDQNSPTYRPVLAVCRVREENHIRPRCSWDVYNLTSG